MITMQDEYIMEGARPRNSWLDNFRIPNHYPTFDKLHKDIGYVMKRY